ncbi:hypothetical protein C8Q79DRAFT_487858 [Trametes meyenii]|nr:hypothetical protein C8Q79DRAFT_487858 [Trametes meyenii]
MQWTLGPLRTAYLSHEDGAHYAVDTELGALEWDSTLPRGGTILHLGPDLRPFTLSMFHQLRCLNIVREAIVEIPHDSSLEPKDFRLLQHCMDYLRQAVMCRADQRLESVRAIVGGRVTVSDITHSCRDWTAVYEAAEVNYAQLLGNV